MIEKEYKESLLCSHDKSLSLHGKQGTTPDHSSLHTTNPSISLLDIPAGPPIVRTQASPSCSEEPTVVLPEVRMVEKITQANHVEPLPPMIHIWEFGRQYKQLDQHFINRLVTRSALPNLQVLGDLEGKSS